MVVEPYYHPPMTKDNNIISADLIKSDKDVERAFRGELEQPKPSVSRPFLATLREKVSIWMSQYLPR
jgi:hypothetical protein